MYAGNRATESLGVSESFPPTDRAWQSRLEALDPKRYAATRNHLLGAVSGLSPYFTHGFLSSGEAVDKIRERTGLTPQDKLFAEFAWRLFFHHVWAHQGDAIFEDLRAGIDNVRYSTVLPSDIREGRTGLAVIDQAVSTLYSTGYLHNHARMWLASYVIHLRHIHWRAGADWLYSHLLDGDLASNHLSWQWVAGTFSVKPYLFNAENVSKYAPAAWHCSATPLDTSYEALEAMARGHQESDRRAFDRLAQQATQDMPALEEPALFASPPAASLSNLHCPQLHNLVETLKAFSSIELVHPWGLRTNSLAPGVGGERVYRLGVVHLPYWARWPWSERRWNFVLTRMGNICDALFIGDARDLLQLLPAKARYYTANDLGARETLNALSELKFGLLKPPRLVEEPSGFCQSFSKYFRNCSGGYPKQEIT